MWLYRRDLIYYALDPYIHQKFEENAQHDLNAGHPKVHGASRSSLFEYMYLQMGDNAQIMTCNYEHGATETFWFSILFQDVHVISVFKNMVQVKRLVLHSCL